MPFGVRVLLVRDSLDRAKNDRRICTCSIEVEYMRSWPRFTRVLNPEHRRRIYLLDFYLARQFSALKFFFRMNLIHR